MPGDRLAHNDAEEPPGRRQPSGGAFLPDAAQRRRGQFVRTGAGVESGLPAHRQAGRIVIVGERVVGSGHISARLDGFPLPDADPAIIGKQAGRREAELRRLRPNSARHQEKQRGGRRKEHAPEADHAKRILCEGRGPAPNPRSHEAALAYCPAQSLIATGRTMATIPPGTARRSRLKTKTRGLHDQHRRGSIGPRPVVELAGTVPAPAVELVLRGHAARCGGLRRRSG